MITTAELWGILKGLSLAWDEGSRQVSIETDSMASIQLINGASPLDPHYNLVLLIRNLLTKHVHCKIEHLWREGNFCADHLAKASTSEQPGLHILRDPPEGRN
ncbi:reverse transcriptase [Thalictrum thalictroides]|uniref:Reverse transcriptase n=1 Tax=Thalictrum thalictroides TaxID=46969 RepID=A0A7J6WUN2_THATH|nr:reverse transcriptase [Thalictrum thalictroides]